MNFCVAILILKMKEIHNIFGILCFIISRKVKMQKKIRAMYREGATTDRMCQKWFMKFLKIYLFLERGEGREREGNLKVW